MINHDQSLQTNTTMPLIAQDSPATKEFKQVPPGSHLGVCYQVIDLGTHQTDFKNEKTGETIIQHKIHIDWELPDEKLDDGAPMKIGKDYTLSLNEKSNLYTDLVGWRGREFSTAELAGFNLENILSKSCLLQVISRQSKKGKDYSFVQSIGQLPKGMKAVKPTNPTLLFSLDMGIDSEEFKLVPEWLQKQIKECQELNAKPEAKAPAKIAALPDPAPEDDDVPF